MVTPDATFDPSISISDSAAACGATCIDITDRGSANEPEVFNYKNTIGAAQTLFFVIDSFDGSTDRVYSVSVPNGQRVLITATPVASIAASTTIWSRRFSVRHCTQAVALGQSVLEGVRSLHLSFTSRDQVQKLSTLKPVIAEKVVVVLPVGRAWHTCVEASAAR